MIETRRQSAATLPHAGSAGATVQSVARRRFDEAQAALLARFEIAGRSRMLAADSDRPVHVIEGGQGHPLVLIHGGGALAAEWASLMRHLQYDHRCIAVDRPGHGISYRVDYREVPDLRADAVAFVQRTLDLLGLRRATLVGNSMGGYFSIAFALAHPERVERLVLMGAPAGIDRWIPFKLRLLGLPLVGPLLWQTVARPSERGLRKIYGSLLVRDASRLVDEQVACGLAAYGIPGADMAWLSLLRRFVTHRGVDDRCYIREELSQLAVPTHFIWGERDAFAPPESGRRACAAIRHATLTVIEQAGHLPWLDAPERCADAIREVLSPEAG